MKTKGLTFQQALEALNDDECIGIKPEKFLGNNYYKKDTGDYLTYFVPLTNTFTVTKFFPLPMLLGKWDLVIKPPLITQQRIFNYWIVIWSNGTISLFNQKPLKATYKRAQHVFEHHQEYIFTYPKMRVDNAKIS